MRYSFKSTDRSLQRTSSKPTRETFMAGNGKRVYIEHVAPKHRIPVIAELFKDIDLQKCNNSCSMVVVHLLAGELPKLWTVYPCGLHEGFPV